jgi:hypothetical protein
MAHVREGSLPSRRFLFCVLAIVACLCAGCAGGSHVRSIAPNRQYAGAALSACLGREHIIASDIKARNFAAWSRSLGPPGITDEIVVVGVGSFGGAVTPTVKRSPLLGPPIDNANLYVFETPALARSGREALVAFSVYGKGVPKPYSAQWALHPPPSSKKDVLALQVVVGNVIVIWQYPRHHVELSNRLIGQCLGVALD